MKYKKYGETLQMGHEKYGKMLRKAMMKCGGSLYNEIAHLKN